MLSNLALTLFTSIAAGPPVYVPPPSSPTIADTTPAATPDAHVEPKAKERKIERIAVYDLEATSDIEPRVARIVTDSVVAELRKLNGLSIVSMDEVRAMLQHESNKQLLGCTDQSCVAEIADALGVDTIVVGNLSHVGNESVIGLRRLNQRAASAQGQASKRLEPQHGEEFLAAVGPLVEQLFPDAPLRAGEKRGVDQKQVLRVNPPPLPSWSTLSVAGVSFALFAGSAATGVGLLLTQEEFGRLATLSAKQTVPGTELVDAQSRGNLLAISTNVLLASALVGGVASALMVPWTDWLGVADQTAN